MGLQELQRHSGAYGCWNNLNGTRILSAWEQSTCSLSHPALRRLEKRAPDETRTSIALSRQIKRTYKSHDIIRKRKAGVSKLLNYEKKRYYFCNWWALKYLIFIKYRCILTGQQKDDLGQCCKWWRRVHVERLKQDAKQGTWLLHMDQKDLETLFKLDIVRYITKQEEVETTDIMLKMPKLI